MSQKERRLLDPGWPWSHQPWTSFVREELGEKQADGGASLGWRGCWGGHCPDIRAQVLRTSLGVGMGYWTMRDSGQAWVLCSYRTWLSLISYKPPPNGLPLPPPSLLAPPPQPQVMDPWLHTTEPQEQGKSMLGPSFLLSSPPPTARRLFPAALRDLGTEIDRGIPERNRLEIMDYPSFFFF